MNNNRKELKEHTWYKIEREGNKVKFVQHILAQSLKDEFKLSAKIPNTLYVLTIKELISEEITLSIKEKAICKLCMCKLLFLMYKHIHFTHLTNFHFV